MLRGFQVRSVPLLRAEGCAGEVEILKWIPACGLPFAAVCSECCL